MSKFINSPIIIIGMHRSGTSFFCELLQKMGVFMGAWRDQEDSESRFFLKINRLLLKQANADWYAPQNYLLKLTDNQFLVLNQILVKKELRKWKKITYFGVSNWLKGYRFETIPFPWGWKDPRTTITLPIWLSIFPNARIIHIIRHGMDVALSLAERALYFQHQSKHPTLYPESQDLLFNVRLWDIYLKQTANLSANLPNQYLEFRFEEFLQTPVPILTQVATFCGIPVPDPLPTNGITSSKGYAFRQKRELWQSTSPSDLVEIETVLSRYKYSLSQ